MNALFRSLPWVSGVLFLAGVCLMFFGSSRQNKRLYWSGILTEAVFAVVFLLYLLWTFASL